MQDTFSLSVSAKFSFGAKQRGLQPVSSLCAEMKSAEEDAYSYTPNVSLSLPLGMGNPCLATQYHTLQPSPVISVSSCHQTGYSLQNDNHAASGYYLPHGLRPNGAPALESPRIEITAYSQYPEDEVEESNSEDHIIKRGVNSIVTLTRCPMQTATVIPAASAPRAAFPHAAVTPRRPLTSPASTTTTTPRRTPRGSLPAFLPKAHPHSCPARTRQRPRRSFPTPFALHLPSDRSSS
ncbi:hypothetical protein L3Q82_013566 [Scortum barcoo]|uniref:Uncharacterized protein n=1 Tax=Scortum barcoo TaxID=214431 RepID=A0ACB8W0A8_9TELE|nr:hypothetical protein L3Q82_013566 [Scortum barcoo]